MLKSTVETEARSLAEAVAGSEGVTQFVPAIRVADGTVRPVGAADSELAWDLARANVLAVIPEDWSGADAGATVECLVLDDARGAALLEAPPPPR